jgi:P-type Mg2+ transporter
MAALDQTRPPSNEADWSSLALQSAAGLCADDVLARLGSTAEGLSSDEARVRLARVGPNALRSHGARPFAVLVRQLRNPLLLLLVAAALTSFAVGEHTGALIILLIICLSVGLGFFNEYRSELAVEALHSQLRHTVLVVRGGEPSAVDVTELVPGDVVRLAVGDVVAADLRLLRADGLECDEAVLTGESLPAEKRSDPVTAPESSLDLASCAFMGTVVREGSGLGVVVRTGGRTEFGAIALKLGERQPQTAFQLGLRDFSLLLVRVTAVLAGSILVLNVVLGRSLLGSVLFALAIAVGLTPQLLPAIVTISLSTGAKRLAERKVVVKRLVSIEDLGNIVVLFTDKTGTLTEGSITFAAALDATGRPSNAVLRAGLLCNEATVSDGRVIGGTSSTRRCGRRRELTRRGRKVLGGSPLSRSTTSAAWRRC